MVPNLNWVPITLERLFESLHLTTMADFQPPHLTFGHTHGKTEATGQEFPPILTSQTISLFCTDALSPFFCLTGIIFFIHQETSFGYSLYLIHSPLFQENYSVRFCSTFLCLSQSNPPPPYNSNGTVSLTDL